MNHRRGSRFPHKAAVTPEQVWRVLVTHGLRSVSGPSAEEQAGCLLQAAANLSHFKMASFARATRFYLCVESDIQSPSLKKAVLCNRVSNDSNIRLLGICLVGVLKAYKYMRYYLAAYMNPSVIP